MSKKETKKKLNKKSNNQNGDFFEHLKNIVNNIDHEFLWSSTSLFKPEDTFYSKGILNITGYSEDEVKNLPERGFYLVYDKDKKEFKEKLDEFTNDKNKKNIKLDYRIKRKDSSIVWVKENIRVDRDSNGNIQNFYGTVSEITDLKEAEERIKESEKSLKKINDSKDKFISILSHDLRAPFTSILGFAEILINEPNLSNSERLEYLTYIHDSSQNQLKLINYLLDWSRLQTGRIKIDPQRIHLLSTVYNCVSSLTGNAIRKNIDIKVNIDENLYVKADERLVTQVITNLISNAIKFSLENKIIEVFADRFNHQFVEFIVKDQGIGISDKNKERLFLIDQVFTTEGTKGEKGTGLGLPLVNEIIEKHGGEIWFYSQVKKGSEFHFTIPCAQNNVIIINNNEKENEIYKKIIRKNFDSLNIITFDNGYKAIDQINKDNPTLIISNHNMPLMNGVKLIESLIKPDKSLNIPIIVLADKFSTRLQDSYKDLGVDSLISKPVDKNKFIRALNSAIK